MKCLPEFAEVQRIAATGQYDVLPVSCELLSDFTTPIETMKILKNVSTHCYLLESALANEKWGRYTFLGYDPKLGSSASTASCGRATSKFTPMTPPTTSARFWRTTKAPASTTCPPSPAAWSATSLTTT